MSEGDDGYAVDGFSVEGLRFVVSGPDIENRFTGPLQIETIEGNFPANFLFHTCYELAYSTMLRTNTCNWHSCIPRNMPTRFACTSFRS